MTEEQIYSALRAAVMYYPKNEKKHLVPQTFAVLFDVKDFNSETLKYNKSHKDTPYFFSRKWAHAEYNPSRLDWGPPVVGISNLGNDDTPDSIKGKTVSRNQYDMQITVMDEFYDKPDMNNEAQRRSVHEINRDTKTIAKYVMQFLYRCKFWVAELTGGGEKIYFLPEHLMTQLQTAGIVSTYSKAQGPREEIVTTGSPAFIPHEAGMEKQLYGTLVNVAFKMPECLEKATWELREYGLTYDKG